MNGLIIIIIFNILFSIFCTTLTIHYVEKHSVHPEHGNYIKVDLEGNPCNPWDSCK